MDDLNVDPKIVQAFARAAQGQFKSIKACRGIPSNSDLNDYTVPGTYAAQSTNAAKTIANIPEPVAGELTVSWPIQDKDSDWTYVIQEFKRYDTGHIFTRHYDKHSNSWTAWDNQGAKDYVFQRGNSDGWEWTKYASGKFEADIVWRATPGTWTNSTNTAFAYVPFYIPFPFTIKEIYSISVTSNNWVGKSAFTNSMSMPRTNIEVYLYSDYKGSATASFSVHVVGKW